MEICIVVSADNTYAKHLGVMLYSLFSTSDNNCKFKIYVLDGGISNRNIKKLNRLAYKSKYEIHFIHIDNKFYNNCPISNHIKIAAYYRISIEYFFPKSCNKLLYLDCDIIIKKDISKLWKIDVSNYVLAAVGDTVLGSNDRLFMDPDELYFNSGVLLINLDNWRKTSISSKAHKFIEDFPDRLFLHDQDALNAVVCGRWLQLHPQWNLQTNMFRLKQGETTFSEFELSEALLSPAIIHFTESSKPWHYMNEHPYRDEYLSVLQCTEWKYRFPNMQNKIISILKPIVLIAYKYFDRLKNLSKPFGGR